MFQKYVFFGLLKFIDIFRFFCWLCLNVINWKDFQNDKFFYLTSILFSTKFTGLIVYSVVFFVVG